MSPAPFIPFALASLLAWGLSGACIAQDPGVVVPPDHPPPTGGIFADVVLGTTAGSAVQSCITGTGIPVCGSPQPQTGPCANNPALGPNDGVVFAVGALGRIELGFLCSAIVEVGVEAGATGASDDFRVWGSVSGGALPIVEISEDGTTYVSANTWPKLNGAFIDNPGFQLESQMLPSARFVRISNSSGQGGVQVDALEALRRTQ